MISCDEGNAATVETLEEASKSMKEAVLKAMTERWKS